MDFGGAMFLTDQVSNGRFLFGIGGGWNVEEMADHGTEFRAGAETAPPFIVGGASPYAARRALA
jgi:hypothetical protein